MDRYLRISICGEMSRGGTELWCSHNKGLSCTYGEPWKLGCPCRVVRSWGNRVGLYDPCLLVIGCGVTWKRMTALCSQAKVLVRGMTESCQRSQKLGKWMFTPGWRSRLKTWHLLETSPCTTLGFTLVSSPEGFIQKELLGVNSSPPQLWLVLRWYPVLSIPLLCHLFRFPLSSTCPGPGGLLAEMTQTFNLKGPSPQLQWPLGSWPLHSSTHISVGQESLTESLSVSSACQMHSSLHLDSVRSAPSVLWWPRSTALSSMIIPRLPHDLLAQGNEIDWVAAMAFSLVGLLLCLVEVFLLWKPELLNLQSPYL